MNTKRNRTVDAAIRMYGLMLSAYPRAHLRQFRPQMLQTFSDMIRDAFKKRGTWGVFIVLIKALFDTASNAVAEHLAERSAYMEMLKRWAAAKMSTEKFDPFWSGFFMGIVCCAMIATGLLMIFFDNVFPIGERLGYGLIAGAALGFIALMKQKRDYDEKMKALTSGEGNHPIDFGY